MRIHKNYQLNRGVIRKWGYKRVLPAFVGVAIMSASLALGLTWLPARADGHHTHYVATTGDDQGGANDCTVEANPCATIGHAIVIAPADSVIHVAGGTYNEHSLAIGKNLTIDGDGAGTTIVDANDLGRVFNITAGTVTIEDLTVTDGSASEGGGIHITSPVTLTDVIVNGNATTSLDGGGIAINAGGSLTMTGGSVTNNTSARHVGGIHNNAGTAVTLSDVTISGNTAAQFGGGLWSNTGTVTLTNVTVNGNTGTTAYGGIRIQNTASLTMTGGAITNNMTNGDGGGLANARPANLTDVTIDGNTAGSDAGGILNSGTLTITGGSITNNTATADNGGGIWNNGTLTVGGMDPGEAVTITGNTAGGQGDGIFRSSGTVTAEGNWWGHLRGPQHTTNPNSGTGQEITGVVDFSPWCADDTCGDYYELPAALTFNVQPTNTVANNTITPAPAIRLVGTGGYRAINATNTIAMTLSGGSTTTLNGTTSIAAVDGDAAFSDLSIGAVGTGYQLNATSAPLTAASSSLFNITTPFSAGDGTEGNPYQITECELLQAMNLELDAHYVLNNNIDCSDTVNWNTGLGFEPVGTFTGNFSGQGYTISDLYIDRPSTRDVGLFSVIGGAATVQNVALVDVLISGSGEHLIGGLAGTNSGTIENSSVSGSVTTDLDSAGGLVGANYQGTIRNSHANVTVTGGSSVGGLIGLNLEGTVERSYATGNVTGSGDAVGGLVGENYGPVTDSYATGNVDGVQDVGGLVGYSGGCVCGGISRSFSVGFVSGDTFVGGLIGGGSSDATESFWDTETSGQATSDSGTGKTTAEMKDILTFSAATWDIEITNGHNLNDGYPFLSWQVGDSSPVWYIFEPSISDGLPDCTESFVDCFVNPVTGANVILEVDDACTINAASVVAESSNTVADSGFDYPAGLMNFTLDCGTPGYTTTIKQYYFDTTNDGFILRKHNPNTNAYFAIEGATIEQTVLDGQTVTIATYQITDGGELDTDGVPNGTIVDPVGLALSAVGAPNTGLGGRR